MTDEPLVIVSDDFTNVMERLVKFGFRPEPLLDLVANRLTNRVKGQFRKSEDPYGIPWKGISHRSGMPLRDTGRLRSSFTYQASGYDAQIGTNTVYARLHSLGFSGQVTVSAHQRLIKQAFGRPLPFPVYAGVKSHARKVEVPARPILPDARGLPDAWGKGIKSALLGYLNKIERGSA